MRNQLHADVRNLRVMDDASGAPALVDVRGSVTYTFACDTLGNRTSLHLISRGGSCNESKRAARVAKIAYESKVLFSTTGAWRERNVAMYTGIAS